MRKAKYGSQPVETAQQVFDAVCRHAASMTAKSVDVTGFCKYRTDDGNACFVGALLSDSEAARMDCHSADPDNDSGSGIYTLCLLMIPPTRLLEHRDLLVRVQGVHDAFDRESWPGQLRAVAKEFGLSPLMASKVGRRWRRALQPKAKVRSRP